MTRKAGGRPPKHTQFKKGQSGNPKGRPKKSTEERDRSAFDILVDKTLTITKNGMTQEVSVEEALEHKTYQAAIAGNRAARREVLRMISKREQALAKRAKPRARPIELKGEMDPDNANEALLLLGIAVKDPQDFGPNDTYDRLKLEPWAVQAALSRRRGGAKLTAKEVSEIKRCTREPEHLKWPRGTEE
ncbi:DUF5681 domain-containing protein [Marimonas sp. MJW-29]|uniref:DUF5681 domain-containing protein n=1 Tax=Sulfitobacter sediminis TaxID=3234186 RepID=A0ABV3RPS5_9RHOB